MSDIIVGLDGDASLDEWKRWHDGLLRQRLPIRYPAATDWSDGTFRQLFLFMYDTSFFDRRARRYRTRELVAEWRASFGRVDEVLLWHAYPRLGFDRRTQFDFYRDMPGGLAALRGEVVDVLHEAGMRVFVDYNPWDAGTYDELADIVHALDADGVMLDTMADAPADLARAVAARKAGVVLAPELRPKDEDLAIVRQSWAQWFDLGEGPSIYRHAWIARPHRQFAIARWDTARRRDIVYGFFNGQGLILWENVFGSWNPYSAEDKALLRQTSAWLDAFGDVFARGEWEPLVPTGIAGLDANRWTLDGRVVTTVRNRTNAPVRFRGIEVPALGTWAVES